MILRTPLPLIACVVLVGMSARIWTLAVMRPEVIGPKPTELRSMVDEPLAGSVSLSDHPEIVRSGIDSVSLEFFDPRAAVRLTPGEDEQPGHAGIDDDVDGVVDNRSELGAMYSDDRCLAPSDAGYDEALSDARCVTITRGAYVPVDKNPESSGKRFRYVLKGTDRGQPWERMVYGKVKGESSWVPGGGDGGD